MLRAIEQKRALQLLVLVFALAMLGCFVLPSAARADEGESKGYWELYRTTITENGREQETFLGNIGYFPRDVWTIWTCEHGRYTETYVANEDVAQSDSSKLALKNGDKVTSVATYDVPKNFFRDTDKISIGFNLSCEVKKRDDLMDLCQKLWIEMSVQFGEVGIYEGEEYFQEWKAGKLKNEEGNDVGVADIDNPNVSDVYSSKSYSQPNAACIAAAQAEARNVQWA